jgi:Tol biopolymer transport system component
MLDGPDVRSELGKILASPVFVNSPRMSRFLKFVVEETLAGNSERIKEYVIALEVFDKRQDYDPHADSSVRTEAIKLRTRLDRYYETEGRGDAVWISIPKGSYVPVFNGHSGDASIAAVNGQSAHVQVPDAVANAALWLRRRLLWTVAAVGVLVSGVVLWTLSTTNTPQTASQEPVPLTSYPGQELQPSFSPDGNQVAFMWNGERQDNFDIYVKEIGSDKPLRLTFDPAKDFSPAWSPDGRSIAFARVLNRIRSGIFVVPVIGGPERKVGETRSPSVFWSQPLLAWSADSKSLAISDSVPGFGPGGNTPASLFLLSIETGERRALTSQPVQPVVDGGPAFAPNGRTLVFLRSFAPPVNNVYLLPLSADFTPAGEPQQLTSWKRYATSPAWMPDGKGLLMAAGHWDNLGLWRVSTSGKHEVRRLGFAGDHVECPSISRQGRLAYSQTSADTNIWRADLSRPGGELLTAPKSLIGSTLTDINPQFSPDGRRVAFCSDRGGTMEIWVSDQHGSNAMQVTSMGAAVTGSPRWSPDGTRIVYDSNKEGQFEVYVVSSTGGTPKRLTNDPAADGAASWSRDGKRIYFMSNRGGTRHIWTIPAEGGQPIQVTKHTGHVAFESPDGKLLFFSERGAEGQRNGMGGLWKVPVGGSDETPVLPSVTFLNLAIAKEGIYFIPKAGAEGLYSIHFYSFAKQKSWPILSIGETASTGISVSPDGRSLLYCHRDELKSDLMLVENFH